MGYTDSLPMQGGLVSVGQPVATINSRPNIGNIPFNQVLTSQQVANQIVQGQPCLQEP